eukprot:4583702-Lingulodinium_polyedra.AAC.1
MAVCRDEPRPAANNHPHSRTKRPSFQTLAPDIAGWQLQGQQQPQNQFWLTYWAIAWPNLGPQTCRIA